MPHIIFLANLRKSSKRALWDRPDAEALKLLSSFVALVNFKLQIIAVMQLEMLQIVGRIENTDNIPDFNNLFIHQKIHSWIKTKSIMHV